jgi:hypothetical protein
MRGVVIFAALIFFSCSAGKQEQNTADIPESNISQVQTDSIIYFPEQKQPATELKTAIPEQLLLLNDEDYLTLCCDTGEPEAIWINHKGNNASIKFVRATEIREYLIVKVEEDTSGVLFNLVSFNSKEEGNSSNICRMRLKHSADAISMASLLEGNAEKGTDYRMIGLGARHKYKAAKSKDCR